MEFRQDFSEDIVSRITARQVELLYSHQSVAIYATMIVVTAVFGFLYSPDIFNRLIVIYVMFTIALSYRLINAWHYSRMSKSGHVNVSRAYRLYVFGIILTGLCFSMIELSLFPFVDLAGQLLLLIVIMGFSSAAHTTMGFKLLPILSFIFLLAIPLLYVVYLSELPNHIVITIAIIFYSAFMLRSSFIFYNSTYTMLGSTEVAKQRGQELKLLTAQATHANEAKSQFLSRMSHELRTPLNAVLGMNELLMRDRNEPLLARQADRVNKISEAGKHLLSLVDDVLDLSRIEAGRMDMCLIEVDCRSIINESMKLVESKAARKAVRIENDASSEIYAVADARRLKQIIVNLLDNAVKYNKQGGVVSIALTVSDDSWLRISVTDTGYGISSKVAGKLFQPFSRLHMAQVNVDGAGIGLSLCKQLVELMDGKSGSIASQEKAVASGWSYHWRNRLSTILLRVMTTVRRYGETDQLIKKYCWSRTILSIARWRLTCSKNWVARSTWLPMANKQSRRLPRSIMTWY